MWLADLDLRRASLFRGRFPHANFRGSCLDGASLIFGDFVDAVFRRSLLRRTNLAGANVQGANFEGADLRGAVLKDADVQGTIFTGARLERTDLRGVRNLGTPGNSILTEEQWRSAITDQDSYADATRTAAVRLTATAIRLANAKTPIRRAIAELDGLGGDCAALKLATADCLIQDTDWLLRLAAAELLDLLGNRRQNARAVESWLSRSLRWWR